MTDTLAPPRGKLFIQTHGSQTGAENTIDYIIDVLDSGGPLDADTMVVSGTVEDDFFLSRSTFRALLHGVFDLHAPLAAVA